MRNFIMACVLLLSLPLSAAAADPEKIHPDLQRLIEDQPDAVVEIIISFADDERWPELPRFRHDQPRKSVVNEIIMQQRQAAVERIRASREPKHQQRARELEPLGVRRKETFWLTAAMVVDMPVAAIQGVAARPDVLYVQPSTSDAPPPRAIWGRTAINSDPMFNFVENAWAGGELHNFITAALIDTGVRATHTLLAGRIDAARDCVNGDADNCTRSTINHALNPGDCQNHGTSSAALFNANLNRGNDYRGVTATRLTSFRVYGGCAGDPVQTLQTHTDAVLRAFDAVVAMGFEIALVEVQIPETENGAVARAADRAFDNWVAVIVTAGNYSAEATVRSPAIAHKSMAVGAVDWSSLATEPYQSRGGGDRVKPDIQAPTNTDSASGNSDTQTRLERNEGVFSGTSGAAPYAAGAATLIRNWYENDWGTGMHPGIIYANLINFGQTYGQYPHATTFDGVRGAGVVRLPTVTESERDCNRLCSGYLHLFNFQTSLDIQMRPWDYGYTPQRIQAAVWWGEEPTQPINIDVELLNPSGTIVASSRSTTNVWEKLRLDGPVAVGTWTLRIRRVGASPVYAQQVFFSVYFPQQ